MRSFKSSFLGFKQKFLADFSCLPQKYEVVYRVFLENKVNESIAVEVALPLPIGVKSFVLAPHKAEVKVEPKLGNTYAVWSLELPPKESTALHAKCIADCFPQAKKCENNITADEYHKDALYKLYSKSNRFISPNNAKVRELAKRIVKIEKTPCKIAKNIHEYLMNTLAYGNPIQGLYSCEDALEKSAVDCGGFSVLFASLCIASGIPARIVFGFWAGYKINTMHAWVEAMLPNGTWISADPSVEHLRKLGRTSKRGSFGFVGSDRIALSHGCDFDIEIGDKTVRVDILQNPIVYSSAGDCSVEVKYEFLTQRLL